MAARADRPGPWPRPALRFARFRSPTSLALEALRHAWPEASLPHNRCVDTRLQARCTQPMDIVCDGSRRPHPTASLAVQREGGPLERSSLLISCQDEEPASAGHPCEPRTRGSHVDSQVELVAPLSGDKPASSAGKIINRQGEGFLLEIGASSAAGCCVSLSGVTGLNAYTLAGRSGGRDRAPACLPLPVPPQQRQQQRQPRHRTGM